MPLDRQIILRDAFAVLNETGLEGLTLRRLAARLGVQAPAIYWHFKNKQELLDEMATHVLREALQGGTGWDAGSSWQEWACGYCTGLRKTLLRYRDGARMFSGTYLTDAELFSPMEACLRKLTGAGFTLRQAVVGLGTLYSYTVGFVIEEQATQLAVNQTNPHYDLAVREQRVNKDIHPLAAEAGTVMFTNYDSRFSEGVTVIVAGLAALLPNADTQH